MQKLISFRNFFCFFLFITVITVLDCNVCNTENGDEKISYNNNQYNSDNHFNTPLNEIISNTWRVLPIRSKEEYDKGIIGGEAEQHPHGIARCLFNPDYIYLSHDVAGVWKSDDAGNKWQKTLDKGLYVANSQSIEVDPINSSVVFLISDNSWDWLADGFEGLYRSKDGGDSWKLVLQTATNYNPKIHRIYRHNIAYDIACKTHKKILRWYVAFPDNGLYRSDDGGNSWSRNPISSLEGQTKIYAIQTHPKDGHTVYIASSRGFFISSTRGTNFKLSGKLPKGDISSIAINPQHPQIIYVTVQGQGLFRSLDSGVTFSELKEFDAARVFINPGYPNVIYLVGLSSNTITSHDGGNNWIEDMDTLPAPGLGRDGIWKSKIAGELTGIAPNPKNPKEAVAFSRATIWKTIDGGQTFKDSSTLFTGYAWGWWNSGVAFDPNNQQRFAFFNCDIGMTITHNAGLYFDLRNTNAWIWYKKGLISWTGVYSGTFQPISNSKIIIASIGGYFQTQLMRSTDEGLSWKLIDYLEENENLFIAFNTNDPNIVYAGNKISNDAGKTFIKVNFGKYNSLNPAILGMCKSYPDTIYAMDKDRYYIIRSDNKGKTWKEYTRPGWKFQKLDSKPTFMVDPINRDKIYTLDKIGDLAIFEGKKWKATGVLALAGGSEIGNFVRAVAIDPNHPNIIYAGMSAKGISCIWRSLDRGKSWEDISYNLPRTGMDAMVVNPHTGELYKGSTIGTWIFPSPYKKL